MRYLILIFALTPAVQMISQSTTQSFDKVCIDGNVEVLLRPDDMYDVDIIESKDDVTFTVHDGRLDIFRADGLSNESAMVTINYKTLSSVDVSSGASVEHEGILNADTLLLKADSSAEMNLKINAQMVKSYVANESNLTLQGKINSLKATCDSDSELNAGSLEAVKVWIHTENNSSATVNASNHVDADAKSGSSIKILGDPETSEVNSSMGGEIIADK